MPSSSIADSSSASIAPVMVTFAQLRSDPIAIVPKKETVASIIAAGRGTVDQKKPSPPISQSLDEHSTIMDRAKLRRRGLEPSAGMLELFGGGPGPASCFDRIPPMPNVDNGRFARSSVLEREMMSKSTQPVPIPNDPSSLSCFDPIPDHDRRAELARQMQQWTSSRVHFNEIPLHPGNADNSSRRSESVNNGRGGGGGGGGGGGSVKTGRDGNSPPIEQRRVQMSSAEPWTDKSGPTTGPLLIKGGQVVNDDSIFIADVLIDDGQIKQVGTALNAPTGVRIIDATGKMVIPGGIDPHTHMQLTFAGVTSVDDFFVGTKAALAGGTTTIVDTVMPNATESLIAAFDRYRAMADAKVACNYALTVAIPIWNTRVRDEMTQLCKEKGVNSFTMHMGYKQQQLMLRDDAIYQAMESCKQIGAIARVHAENGDIIHELERHMISMGITGPEGHLQSRPEQLEAEATGRACMLGHLTNCPVYIQTVMSRGAAQSLAKSRQTGCIVFGEVTAAAVGTDGTHYFNKCWRHAAAHVTSPPLRPDVVTSSVLVDMLAAGQLYTTASAHCVFSTDQRSIGANDFTKIPNGVNGVEERLAVVWEKAVHAGKIDPMRFVAITSTNAAKLLNLYPKKGRIAVGADADIVIWDPSAKQKTSARNQLSMGDFNVFEGMTSHGSTTMTICGGRIVFENGQVAAVAGSGKYISLTANSPYIFGVIQQRERVCKPEKIERIDTPAVAKPKDVASTMAPPAFHSRPPTSSGGRNQNDSSFSISGAQIDDAKGSRAQTKISQPPGGKSTALW